ncbi:glyoxalase [Caballeronia sp. SEWSISQ10-4 2]|uniref:VOC family protein n=1 Tax=Caballeronia sp. SEWSISQ10-4 2 TaxID=2937438 RepID=UPI0026546DA2|nr:VOC family protein [Caballeronia sp. SEWSISQ10-4 2]MDN7179522.1 glyoxalase [Caballeronia sp. SEWSISQ10-4 2]
MADVDIQAVYFVAKDIARLEDFYVSALGMPVQFRDENKWTQFRLQRSAFALSSAEEAAEGAVGAVPVFQVAGEAQDEVRQKILSTGGQLLAKRDMGTHGIVATYKDPEENIFQVFSKSSTL